MDILIDRELRCKEGVLLLLFIKFCLFVVKYIYNKYVVLVKY